MENPTVTEILRSAAVAVVRHFISIVAAYLISKGLVAPEILSESNLLVLAGGVVTALISLGWIIYRKLSQHRLVQAALNAPAGAKLETVERDAAHEPLLGT